MLDFHVIRVSSFTRDIFSTRLRYIINARFFNRYIFNSRASMFFFFFFIYKEIIFFKHVVNVCFCCFIKKEIKKKETLLDRSLLKDIDCKGKNCDRRMGSRIHCKRIRCRREYNFVSNLEKMRNIRESKMNEGTF